MKIGNFETENNVFLAPMAGVTDLPFRKICRRYGAGLVYSEMVSAKGLYYNDKKTADLMRIDDEERPCAIQIFGSDADIMAEVIPKVMAVKPDIIDINMGCPAPKVASNGGGSALMKEPLSAGKIVAAVVKAVNIPVTVKMRTGYDNENINAVYLAQICEDAGAAAITVHGRTRPQMYTPGIDYKTIAEVKKAVKIPVIANGDVTGGKSAEYMYSATGCDMVSVGRAAEGNPFIFAEINAYFEKKPYQEPPLFKRLEVLKKQVALMSEYKDPHIAVLEARKHAAWYMQGLNGAAALRRLCGEISSMADIERICEKALEQNKDM